MSAPFQSVKCRLVGFHASLFFGFSLLTGVSACSSVSQRSVIPTAERPDVAVEEPENQEVSRIEWLRTLPQNMGIELCDKDSQFRSCYPKSGEECELRVQQVTLNCAQQRRTEIPRKLKDSTGQDWGARIGGCANQAMLHFGFSSNAECQQAGGQMQSGSVSE